MDRDGPGSQPAADLDALLARIEALEARLAELESAPAAPPVAPPVAHVAPVAPPVIPVAPPRPPAYQPDLGTPPWQALRAAPPLTWPQQAPEEAPVAGGPAPELVETRWPAEPQRVHRPSFSLRDLEERFAGRALAWTGGLALVAAAIFFLSLAFSRGWINEPVRVLIGLGAGTGAFGLGGVLLIRRSALLGHVLTAVGLGVTSISLFAATRLYDLVGPELGLLAALITAVAAAALAVRTGSVIVAAYGLIAALIAPPLVGASPDLLTLGFVAVTLVGTTGIALFRSWRWLPPLAFVLAAPQLASWLTGNPIAAQAMIALAGFWLINVIAAAGEELRIRRDDLRPSSATLVLANAAFLLWGGFTVLVGDLEPLRGTFLGAAAAAHVLLGAWFLGRQGLQHLFGNLVAGTGVACLTMAAAVQLGAPFVPLAWAAEAVALAWLAERRLHVWSALAALVLAGLTVGHLLALEYPLSGFGLPSPSPFPVPFQHLETASLASALVALVVAGALVRVRWIRSVLAGAGVALAAYAVTFEVSGPALAAALVALVLAGLLLDRLAARLPTAGHATAVERLVGFAWFGTVGSLVAGAVAVLALVIVEYPAGQPLVHFATPFLHPEGASLGIVVAGLVAVGVLAPVRWVRSGLGGLGLLLITWALRFEVEWTLLVGTLVLLLPVGVLLDRVLGRFPDERRFAALAAQVPFTLSSATAGAVAWIAAAGYALGEYLPPERWGADRPPDVPFSDERALVGGLLIGSALAAVRWLEPWAARRAAAVVAIAAAAYLVPFEVYADGVSVLWVALAACALVAARWDAAGLRAFTGLAAALAAGAAVVAFTIVASPDRLWVIADGRTPLLAGWPLALLAVAGAAYAAGRLASFERWRTWLDVAAGAVLVYLASVAVVDVFQRMVGGATAVEELSKQGQVALSTLWTTIGAALLGFGVARGRPMFRHAGFALLGIATAKVFVIDLASMDVAYRAVVFAALGLLLLLSAALLGRFRGPRSGPRGIAGGTSAAA